MPWPVDSRMRNSSVIIFKRTSRTHPREQGGIIHRFGEKSSAPASRPATRSDGWSQRRDHHHRHMRGLGIGT